MRNPIGEMAERATRLLLEQIDGRAGSRPMRMIIPPDLVRRATALSLGDGLPRIGNTLRPPVSSRV